jgi:hypothetical protein
VIITTTKDQVRTSSSSAVSFGVCGLFSLINLLLQDRCDQILRALLREQALGLLAVWFVEVVRVLARVSVPIFQAADQCKK